MRNYQHCSINTVLTALWFQDCAISTVVTTVLENKYCDILLSFICSDWFYWQYSLFSYRFEFVLLFIRIFLAIPSYVIFAALWLGNENHLPIFFGLVIAEMSNKCDWICWFYILPNNHHSKVGWAFQQRWSGNRIIMKKKNGKKYWKTKFLKTK